MDRINNSVILVTGMSGAGKTSTMSIFEDMGYLVIDNLPVSLLVKFVEMRAEENMLAYDKVVIGVRLIDFPEFVKSEAYSQIKPLSVFLNCSDDELRRRYKSNRRTHPLIILDKATTIDEAIENERALFNEYESFANVSVDTTFTKKKDLIDIYERQLDFSFMLSTKIVFQSFGFRYGIPLDADYVFDVRFLTNPYYDESLKLLTGNDAEVYEAVMNDEKTQPFIRELIGLLDLVLKGNLEMDRGVVNIAIGCTGGQHRSVSIANHLTHVYANRLSSIVDNVYPDQALDIVSYHRDLEKNQRDVHERSLENPEKNV